MWKAFRVKQSLENGITEEKNKSGFRKKLIFVQLLTVLVAVMLFCSGCAGKMNAKKIFRQSSEKYAESNFFSKPCGAGNSDV